MCFCLEHKWVGNCCRKKKDSSLRGKPSFSSSVLIEFSQTDPLNSRIFRYPGNIYQQHDGQSWPFRVLGKDNYCYVGLINKVHVLPHTRKRFNLTAFRICDVSARRAQINVNVTIPLPSCRKIPCSLNSEIRFFLVLI